MKKLSLVAIRDALVASNFANTEILAELDKEINRGAEEKARKSALYAQAKDIVLDVIRIANNPVTASEIFDNCDTLPEGFTKAQVQYGLTHYWVDDVVKHEGKVNTYTLKA